MIIQAYTEEDKDMGLAKDISETLMKHYPGHLWAVYVKGGVAIIKALNISSLWGYVLKLTDIGYGKIRDKDVMRAGGEILERAKLERAGYTGKQVDSVDGIANYQTLGVR